MKLDKNYSLDNDANQWILNYEREGEINPKTNKPTISRDKWYCRSLQSALKRYLNESVKPSLDVQELYANIDCAIERIIELTNNNKL